MIKSKLSFLAILLLFGMGVFAQSPFLAHKPTISPDGSKYVFTYQGDIWLASVNDTKAQRLTVHAAYDGSPRWSPDGKKIAFTSSRYGNNDVFVMNVDGSALKRLTYHTSSDVVVGWSSNSDILFSTKRAFVQIGRESEIHSVGVNGGTPVRSFDFTAISGDLSPNKRFYALETGVCRTSREDYRGAANRDILLYDTKNKTFSDIANFSGNDILPQWINDKTLYFVSAHNAGKYNIYKIELDGEGKISTPAVAVTNFKDDGIRFFSVSKDGQTILFERQDGNFSMDNNGKVEKLKVQIPEDSHFDPVQHLTLSSGLSGFAVSPKGKYSLLELRGDIYVSENNKEKKKTTNITSSNARDRNAEWLNDSTIIYSSDVNGQYDFYIAHSDKGQDKTLIKALKFKHIRLTSTNADERNPIVSPDGKKIAFIRGRGQLTVADISGNKMKNEIVLLDGWSTPSGISWSPDSKWLAYSLKDLEFNSEIYIQGVEKNAKAVNISMHPRGDHSPVWSKDGSKLAFLSTRNNDDNNIWFVWLKKEDWEKTKTDWEEVDDAKKDTNSTKKIQIDFDRIYERTVQVTALPANQSELAISKDGKTFYFVNNGSGRSATYRTKRNIFSVQWDGTKLKQLTTDGQGGRAFLSDKKGTYIYMSRSSKLARLKMGKGTVENLPFTAYISIDHKAERKQMYEEACRIIDQYFYDPNFHGHDWEATKKKYRNWILNASTDEDFYSMFNIMLGQINASHMGIYGKGRAKTQTEKTGLLGIDFDLEDNGLKVTHIIPNSPATRSASKIAEGDIIVSVDGVPVNKSINFYSLMTNKVNKQVLLEVKNKNGKKRDVIIRPTSSLSGLLYKEWVEEQRSLTNKYSNGRLGYLHIRGMNWSSFEEFQRELTAAGYGKEGIVIDVRYNGGGWTTDYLMAVLNVKQHAYTIPRGAAENLEKEHQKFVQYYPFSERLPLAAYTKPSIALCNEASYSNAEIFAHAFKTLGIGKLVGKPTFGAVISTSGQGLINGSYIRTPFRGWYVKATEKNMEFEPAIPDFIVENAHDSRAKGEDLQLKKAVDELLKTLK